MRLLGISGSVSKSSSTRTAVARALTGAAKSSDEVETELLHLGEYDIATADGRQLSEYDGDTATVLSTIIESDAYVIGTPVYRASYSGLLKNVFDLIPRGQWQADVAPLENAAVGLIATGASYHHYLAIDTSLRPITAFFGAHAVGGGLYAHNDHFVDADDGGYHVTDKEIADRLETLGKATVELAEAIDSSHALASIGPQI